jgi:hypothetical protein
LILLHHLKLWKWFWAGSPVSASPGKEALATHPLEWTAKADRIWRFITIPIMIEVAS